MPLIILAPLHEVLYKFDYQFTIMIMMMIIIITFFNPYTKG